MQDYNNIVMWGSLKRLAFRLLIRSRQVRHKLSKIRMRFIDLLSDNILVINDLSLSEQEHTRRIVTQIKLLIDAIALLSKNDNYEQIYIHVNQITLILGVQLSMQTDNNNNNNIKNRLWARLCLNLLMSMYGEQIVTMAIGLSTSDDDSSEEEYPYGLEQLDI